MKALRAFFQDGRRSQRGSVLSAVLIIVAFLGIISGALTTALSTNFLLSRTLVNRVENEAAVNSAAELTLNQFQTTQLAQTGCPQPMNPFVVNGRSVMATYPYCVQRRIAAVPPSQFGSFGVDGTHVTLSGLDEYLVGDTRGNVFAYPFGQFTPSGTWRLGGQVTGPPQAMLDPNASSNVWDLVPVHQPNNVNNADCGSAQQCVALVVEGRRPSSSVQCFMPANATVGTRPAAAGSQFPGLIFFGDRSGGLFAYQAMNPNGDGDEGNNCVQVDSTQAPGGSIVAGPIVLQNGSQDEVYLVTSSGSSSTFLHYTFSQNKFTLIDQPGISASNAVGMAMDPNANQIAVTFAAGAVAMVRISNGFHPTGVTVIGLGTPIGDGPSWSNAHVIGVGGANGTLYLLNPNLSSAGSYAIGTPGWTIPRTPGADAAGDWFFGANDASGNAFVYEMQQTTKMLTTKYGNLGGPIGSAVVVADCPNWTKTVCVYLGLVSGSPTVPLDGRDATLTACIINSTPPCSNDNPRLWAQAEVRQAVGQGTVHVDGWSYYSP